MATEKKTRTQGHRLVRAMLEPAAKPLTVEQFAKGAGITRTRAYAVLRQDSELTPIEAANLERATNGAVPASSWGLPVAPAVDS